MIGRLIETSLEAGAILLLVCLMAVTGLDVIGRYMLNAPLPGAFELTELLLGALIFAALPLVSRSAGHVDVDIVTSFLPRGVQHALAFLIAAISAATLCFFAWRLMILGNSQLMDGAHSESLHVPFAPFAYFGALACVLAGLFSILREEVGS